MRRMTATGESGHLWLEWAARAGMRFAVLTLVALSIALGMLAACGPRSTGPVDLYAEVAPVQYRRAGGGSSSLTSPGQTQLSLNDAVTVAGRGLARMLFGDFLEVKVYRDSALAVTGVPAANAPPAYRMRLEGGSLQGTLDPQRLAERRVQIDTEWAVIKALGTIFFVHYDARRELTWVVVKRGQVSVTAGSVEVIVESGQQTWVEPRGTPVGPLRACRSLVGNLFPLVDDLTTDFIPDLELLCQEDVRPEVTPSGRPTSTRAPTHTVTPTPTATPRRTRTPTPTRVPEVQFAVNPETIQACACTTLTWSAQNVREVYVEGQRVQLSGTQQDCPKDSRAYTLRAVTAAGEIVRTASVRVQQPAISFRADQTSVGSGQCTVLRWDVDNVKAVYLDGAGVAGHDSRQVCPSRTRTYNLRVVTACGEQTRQVTVNVGLPDLVPFIRWVPASYPDLRAAEVTISNVGSAAVNRAIRVRYSTTLYSYGGDSSAARFDTVELNLAPGAATTYIAASWPSYYVSFAVELDIDNVVDELNENNNWVSLTYD